MSSNTPKVKNPLTYAIRQAANSVGSSKGRLGDFFRRISYRKGRSVAIIATARKLTVIIYRMLETGMDYSYGYGEDDIGRIKKAQIKGILKKIKQFGIKTEELNLAQ